MKINIQIVREINGKKFYSFTKRQRGSVNRARIKKSLLERDGDTCFYCGKPLENYCTVEHILSISNGGTNSIENLVLSHDKCNREAKSLSCYEKMNLAVKNRIKKHV